MKRETVLPKNIRQIGEIQQEKRVYLEDYVMTFIRKREQEEEKGTGILLGSRTENEDGTMMFITGAMLLDGETEEMRQKYFPELDTVGYYLTGPLKEENLKEMADPSVPEPALVFHLQEGEENLYWSEGQQCSRMKGYFIFYERNPQMQKYMADCCEPQKVEEEEGVSDHAIVSFREKVKEKRMAGKAGGVRYLAGSFLTLTILLLGVTIIQNYDKMKNMEEVISQISMEQERERLQLAAEYAAAEAASASVAVSDQKDETMETSDGEVSASSNDILADLGMEELPSAEESGEQLTESREQTTESREQTTESREQMPESAEEKEDAAAAGSSAVLADTGTSQAARALAERNYSAEEAGTVLSNLPEEIDEIAAIPGRSAQSTYTVKYGDTLAGISQRYYGNLDRVEEICALNEIDDANMIVPGQKIVLP